MPTASDPDYIPAEVYNINLFKRWWYAISALLILATGFISAGIIASREPRSGSNGQVSFSPRDR